MKTKKIPVLKKKKTKQNELVRIWLFVCIGLINYIKMTLKINKNMKF